VLLTNSIVSGNTNLAETAANNISGPVDRSGSYNVVGTGGSGGLSASLKNKLGIDDPKLGALQFNGGPTMTCLPLSGSPVVDAGTIGSIYNPAEFDQRGTGFYRVANGRIDIGAVEVPGLSIAPPPPGNLALNALNLNFEDKNALPTGYSQMALPDETVLWWRQTSGTSDYYNTDGFMGRTGSSSAGFASPPPDGSKGFVGVGYQAQTQLGRIMNTPRKFYPFL
jgi:hypothetical protein